MIKAQIDAIEAKIAKHGGVTRCGWDPADHKDFLRIKTKHKDRLQTVAFMTEMRRAVPSIDEDEINNHVAVFIEVEALLAQKKSLMSEYKQAKKEQAARAKVDSQNEMFSNLNSDLGLIGDDIKRGMTSKSSGRAQLSGEERARIKEQLTEWKREKEKKKLNDIEDTGEHRRRIELSLKRREDQKRRE